MLQGKQFYVIKVPCSKQILHETGQFSSFFPLSPLSLLSSLTLTVLKNVAKSIYYLEATL